MLTPGELHKCLLQGSAAIGHVIKLFETRRTKDFVHSFELE